ncbi:MAG TPA: hypothetical protein VN083_10390, partial [Vicinamibacteria bacterium]|nr:hypothetical protein [Vicinamibacteria bacterium]
MRTNSHAPKALIFALALSASLLGGPPPSPLRYDLSPGDHLVYHEFLERESQGTDWSALTKTELTSHLLVIGEDSGHVEVGFARDRARAELVRYVERGHDRTKREEAGFAHDLESRDPHFAEANWLTKTGASILPWSALREWPSEVLPALREVEPFPTEPVDLGSTWRDTTMLGLLHRAAAWETKDGKNCLRVEASRVGAPLSLRYWFSPETGVLVALEFDGHYPAPGRSIHETLRLELVERRRKEDLSQWLSDPDLQRGALAALFISDAPPPDPARLHGLLGRGDAAVDGSVLSLLYRRHWPPPPLEVLGDLARPPHPARLRGLALRALESLPPGPEAQAILAPALVDP